MVITRNQGRNSGPFILLEIDHFKIFQLSLPPVFFHTPVS